MLIQRANRVKNVSSSPYLAKAMNIRLSRERSGRNTQRGYSRGRSNSNFLTYSYAFGFVSLSLMGSVIPNSSKTMFFSSSSSETHKLITLIIEVVRRFGVLLILVISSSFSLSVVASYISTSYWRSRH